MFRFPVIATILLLISFLPLRAQQAPDVRVHLSADSLAAGQTFDIAVSVNSGKTVDQIIYPDSSFFPESIGFRSVQRFRSGETSDSVVYQLQFFAISDITLPPLPVTVISGSDTTSFYSNSIFLPYKPTLDEDESTLKPLKPVFDFGRILWPYILGAVVLALLGLWLWFYFRKHEEEQVESVPTPPVRFIDPLDTLSNQLEVIKSESDITRTGNFKDFYSGIGDAIRRYYEDLYDIPALESTSRELFRYLDAFGVDPELVKFTRQILSRADMVKFAKYTPTVESALSVHVMATNFVARARSVDSTRIERLKQNFEQRHGLHHDDTSPLKKGSGGSAEEGIS